jgi:hypothetical protein
VNEELLLAGEAFLEGDDGCQIEMSKKEVGFIQVFYVYNAGYV